MKWYYLRISVPYLSGIDQVYSNTPQRFIETRTQPLPEPEAKRVVDYLASHRIIVVMIPTGNPNA